MGLGPIVGPIVADAGCSGPIYKGQLSASVSPSIGVGNDPLFGGWSSNSMLRGCKSSRRFSQRETTLQKYLLVI